MDWRIFIANRFFSHERENYSKSVCESATVVLLLLLLLFWQYCNSEWLRLSVLAKILPAFCFSFIFFNFFHWAVCVCTCAPSVTLFVFVCVCMRVRVSVCVCVCVCVLSWGAQLYGPLRFHLGTSALTLAADSTHYLLPTLHCFPHHL